MYEEITELQEKFKEFNTCFKEVRDDIFLLKKENKFLKKALRRLYEHNIKQRMGQENRENNGSGQENGSNGKHNKSSTGEK